MTVIQYSTLESAESAELSGDVVLAEQSGRLYVFTRDPADPGRLVSQGLDGEEVIELVRSLAIPAIERGSGAHPTAPPSSSARLARARASLMRRLRRR